MKKTLKKIHQGFKKIAPLFFFFFFCFCIFWSIQNIQKFSKTGAGPAESYFFIGIPLVIGVFGVFLICWRGQQIYKKENRVNVSRY